MYIRDTAGYNQEEKQLFDHVFRMLAVVKVARSSRGSGEGASEASRGWEI